MSMMVGSSTGESCLHKYHYPFTSIPLLIYSTLPAICLFSGKFIMPITYQASGWHMLLLLAFILNGLSEIRWSGVSIQECWRNQQFWLIAGLSSHLCAVIKAWGNMTLGCKLVGPWGQTMTFRNNLELYTFKSTSLLLLPTALILINLLEMLTGLFSFFAHGYGHLGRLLLKLFYALVIVLHLHPFLKGLLDRKPKIPTVVVLWLQLDPFTSRFKGPDAKDCGIECSIC